MWHVVNILDTIYNLIAALLTLTTVAAGLLYLIGLLGRNLYLGLFGLLSGDGPAVD